MTDTNIHNKLNETQSQERNKMKYFNTNKKNMDLNIMRLLKSSIEEYNKNIKYALEIEENKDDEYKNHVDRSLLAKNYWNQKEVELRKILSLFAIYDYHCENYGQFGDFGLGQFEDSYNLLVIEKLDSSIWNSFLIKEMGNPWAIQNGEQLYHWNIIKNLNN